ncbi:hypothetical protein JW758_02715 [Candidatus Peregrinibacteria bacterium]|nr:hypothetical protein [Candidatus Peregrinibacteria bacterium]
MDNVFLGGIIGPYLLIMGLSFLLYAKVWVKLMKELAQSHTAVVIGMALALILGLAIIQVHNVWEMSANVVITIFGWAAFLKGLFYFLAPGVWLKSSINTFAKPNFILGGGVVLTILGAWMSYIIYIA